MLVHVVRVAGRKQGVLLLRRGDVFRHRPTIGTGDVLPIISRRHIACRPRWVANHESCSSRAFYHNRITDPDLTHSVPRLRRSVRRCQCLGHLLAILLRLIGEVNPGPSRFGSNQTLQDSRLRLARDAGTLLQEPRRILRKTESHRSHFSLYLRHSPIVRTPRHVCKLHTLNPLDNVCIIRYTYNCIMQTLTTTQQKGCTYA